MMINVNISSSPSINTTHTFLSQARTVIHKPLRRTSTATMERQRSTAAAGHFSLGLPLLLVVVLLLPITTLAWQPRVSPSMQQEPSSKRHAALQRREDSLFHQTAGFASAFFLLSSPSFALPTPVSAAEDKTAEIKEARDKLLVELEEGKNINRLETAIQNADWDTLKQVGRGKGGGKEERREGGEEAGRSWGLWVYIHVYLRGEGVAVERGKLRCANGQTCREACVYLYPSLSLFLPFFLPALSPPGFKTI